MKLRYESPPENIRKGIRWLEVEEGDGGSYIFQYEDIHSPCKWDNWHASIEEALSDWEEAGVSRSDWNEVA